MTATDFEYAGEMLSEHNFMICQFGSSSGFETSTAGSKLSFSKTTSGDSKKFMFSSAKYESPFEGAISVCKKDGSFVTEEEYSTMLRWLNRTSPNELRIVDPLYWEVFFTGSFNVEKVEHRGRVVGFNLSFVSTSPFGHLFPITEEFTLDGKKSKTIIDLSDEVGHIYPNEMSLLCLEDGDLKLHNSIEDRTMVILNCTKGEKISLDCENQVIQTSNENHKICDDFNFLFFRLANDYDTNENILTSNISCKVSFTYKPNKKVVF